MYVKEAINETALIQGRIQKIIAEGGGEELRINLFLRF